VISGLANPHYPADCGTGVLLNLVTTAFELLVDKPAQQDGGQASEFIRVSNPKKSSCNITIAVLLLPCDTIIL